MLFNSEKFILFFAAVLIIARILPKNRRKYWNLIASYGYYMLADLPYTVLLAGVTALCYLAGIWIEEGTEKQRARRTALSVVLLTGILCLFKVWDAMRSVLTGILGEDASRIAVPLGISYYVFTLIGYLVDVKRGTVPAERDPAAFALFVAFFPQILAGPIARTGLLPQYREGPDMTYDSMIRGLRRFLLGAFRKVVLADGLAILVDGIWRDPEAAKGILLWIAVLLYAFQLYADFCGYSDMALGCACMLGYRLDENFRFPYYSLDFAETWGRWHISLSDWLRDYVYFPLGGSRKGKGRTYLNLMLVFMVSGLWHGIGVGYLIWGALCGLGRIGVALVKDRNPGYRKQIGLRSVRAWLARALNFLYWSFCFFFFRVDPATARKVPSLLFAGGSVSDALKLLGTLAQNGITQRKPYLVFFFGSLLFASVVLGRLDRIGAGLSAVYEATDTPFDVLGKRERWFLYITMGILVLLFFFLTGSGASAVSFIYAGY